jgi:hypothetical protein
MGPEAQNFFLKKGMSERDRSESEQQGLPSTGEIWNGSKVFFGMIIATELRLAAKLGNEERFEAWRQTEFFDAARQEWWGGWERFALGHHGLLASLNFRIDVVENRVKLGPMKDLLLVLLRHLDEPPEETLRGMAEVIHVAALQGDIKFFRKDLPGALRSGGRRKATGFFLASYILGYWFSGSLWLMKDEAARAALSAYTGHRDITQEAYRKSRERLGLNGHRDRVKASPVLWYEPEKKIYKYGPGWTRMKPHLSM